MHRKMTCKVRSSRTASRCRFKCKHVGRLGGFMTLAHADWVKCLLALRVHVRQEIVSRSRPWRQGFTHTHTQEKGSKCMSSSTRMTKHILKVCTKRLVGGCGECLLWAVGVSGGVCGSAGVAVVVVDIHSKFIANSWQIHGKFLNATQMRQ